MAIIAEIVGFVISWLFFALAIYITASLFGSKKSFGKALVMALILELINFLLTLLLPALGWVSLLLMFIFLIVAFIKTYDFSTGKALIAAIVCIIIIFLLLILIGIILGAIAFLFIALP